MFFFPYYGHFGLGGGGGVQGGGGGTIAQKKSSNSGLRRAVGGGRTFIEEFYLWPLREEGGSSQTPSPQEILDRRLNRPFPQKIRPKIPGLDHTLEEEEGGGEAGTLLLWLSSIPIHP